MVGDGIGAQLFFDATARDELDLVRIRLLSCATRELLIGHCDSTEPGTPEASLVARSARHDLLNSVPPELR